MSVRIVLLLVLPVAAFESVPASDESKAESPGSGPGLILQKHVSSLKATQSVGEETTELEISPAALLSYSDSARRYLAGGVWRMGTSGRPRGLVTMELWPDDARPQEGIVHHELSAFVDGGLEVRTAGGTIWRPTTGVLKLRTLSDDVVPSAAAERRMLEMKRLARRFAASEVYRGDRSELRLLPRPIDRYKDQSAGIQDAAMFVFAYGTNPELILLLESNVREWRYALVRLSWAELRVTFDGEQVQVFPAMTSAAPNAAYTSLRESVALPSP